MSAGRCLFRVKMPRQPDGDRFTPRFLPASQHRGHHHVGRYTATSSLKVDVQGALTRGGQLQHGVVLRQVVGSGADLMQ